MSFIINILILFSFIKSYRLEINLKEYRNDHFRAVSSAGRALPF